MVILPFMVVTVRFDGFVFVFYAYREGLLKLC